MYIEKIKIDKFRVLEDIEIHFQPPGGATADPETGNVVNVIAGVNGSGKTTLLDFLDEMKMPWLSDGRTRYFAKAHRRDPIDNGKIVQSIFRNTWLKNTPDFQLFNGDTDLSPSPDFEAIWHGNELSSWSESDDFKLYYYKFGWIIKKSQDGVKDLYEYLEKGIYHFILEEERKSHKSSPDERKKDAINVFNKIFDNITLGVKLNSVSAGNNGYQVLFIKGNNKIISIRDLSDGEKSLFFHVISLCAENFHDSVILIDEPEVALHPAWQQKIMQIYSRIGKNNQFIVATHSPQIIASVPYKNRILLRKEDGKIQPVHMNQPPSGVDVNSILSEIMGADPRPPELLKLYAQYRKFVEERKENTPEALAVKAQLSEESDHSRFMQEMAFLIELRDAV